MASSSKSSGKSKRATQLDTLDCDDCPRSTETQGDTSGKRLKKDDSGINVVEENSSSEDNNCSESHPEEQKIFGQSSPDSGNIEPCSFADLRQQDNGLKASNVNEGASSSSSLDENDSSASKFNDFTQRLENKSSSDSDSDHSSEKGDSTCDSDHTYGKCGKNYDKKYDPTPDTPKPKHKWIAPIAITSRQYGLSQKYSPDSFRYNCYGSLHVVERLELMDKMRKHEGCVNALNFNSTGTKLASGSDDLDIVVWDWTIGVPLLDYNSGHRSNVFQAKFMPLSQDSFIVSSGRDGQVRVGELSSSGECRKTRKLAQHKGAAHKLAIQMDSPHTFYSCGEDAAVYEIDLRAEKPEKLVIVKEDRKKVPLYSIFANPLKSFEYVVAGRSPYVKVYDTRFTSENNGFLRNICPEHMENNDTKNVTSVVYNYNGAEILASYNDEDIYSFQNDGAQASKYLHRYKGHKNSQTVKGVNYFGPKSEFVVSGSDCGFIFFWEKESEHVVKFMYGDEGGVVNCLEPNPVMPVLATSGLDDDIKVWVPSCELPPDLSSLRKHLISNMKEREEERRNCPEAFIDQTIWFLMQHLARSRGQTATTPSERDERNISLIELSSSSDSDSHDEDLEFQREVQCNPS